MPITIYVRTSIKIMFVTLCLQWQLELGYIVILIYEWWLDMSCYSRYDYCSTLKWFFLVIQCSFSLSNIFFRKRDLDIPRRMNNSEMLFIIGNRPIADLILDWERIVTQKLHSFRIHLHWYNSPKNKETICFVVAENVRNRTYESLMRELCVAKRAIKNVFFNIPYER